MHERGFEETTVFNLLLFCFFVSLNYRDMSAQVHVGHTL